MGFRYQGFHIFKNNITEIVDRSSLNVCRYILHFDKKGNLQNVIENNYGSKIDPKINNNTKYNDKIFRGQLNLPFRFSKRFQGIFIHSDTTVQKIKTNIQVYLIKDINGDIIHDFDTLKSVIDFLNLKKSYISYHLKKYQFLKIENGQYLEKHIY